MKRHGRPGLERGLRAYRAPGEDEAFERGLQVVRGAHRDAPRPVPRRAPALRIALAGAAAAVAAIGLTPAGAEVRGWIDDRIGGVEHERLALTRLPGAGRLLVTSSGGTWVVSQDGSRRRLGPFRDATWSPGGLYVAATRGRQLFAVNPIGEVRWSVSRPARVSDPRWSPSGVRVAYRSGHELRAVWGNGTNDVLVEPRVGHAAPAWRPPPRGVTPALDVLAYADHRGRILVRDVPTLELLSAASPGFRPVAIEWLSNRRLVVAGREQLVVMGPGGNVLTRVHAEPGTRFEELASSPAAGRLAVIRSSGEDVASAEPELTGLGASSELLSIRFTPDGTHRRALFAGPGKFSSLAFSPDGRWLVMGWPGADQWLFLRPVADRKLLRGVIATGQIARQFDPGGDAPAGFPRIDGWCCDG